jgi:hypothetical protein
MLSEDTQIQALVHLLRDLEWSGNKDESEDYRNCCPECRYIKPYDGSNAGHSWQCQLAQALDFYEDIP